VIEAQGDLSAAEIAARTRKAAGDFERTGKRLGLVIVDHLEKVRPTKNYRGNRVMEVGKISNAMANLAQAENVAVLALHQLNRAVEGDNKRRRWPISATPATSSRMPISCSSHTARATTWSAPRTTRAVTERRFGNASSRQSSRVGLAVAKQRNRETTSIELFCDMPCNVIRDLDRRHA
jgi:replicative DNA helicase